MGYLFHLALCEIQYCRFLSHIHSSRLKSGKIKPKLTLVEEQCGEVSMTVYMIRDWKGKESYRLFPEVACFILSFQEFFVSRTRFRLNLQARADKTRWGQENDNATPASSYMFLYNRYHACTACWGDIIGLLTLFSHFDAVPPYFLDYQKLDEIFIQHTKFHAKIQNIVIFNFSIKISESVR